MPQLRVLLLRGYLPDDSCSSQLELDDFGLYYPDPPCGLYVSFLIIARPG